ncbi:chemotaxis protein CheW [Orenia marismortui]|uniref:Purine-binding chemotaxis protein CheW n=1 Tax=Orenia marismortui TaxID=46469 RepID=A0A4R8GVX7_9FIRM|nr:chemotaxis protein CheW [Orenia marismortui]TDX47824.1 purine-binding chemotaxis protein CheW [Orenia marismortui]
MRKTEQQDNTMNILNQQLTNISAENQFLTFKVMEEEYGVDVLKVQEIIRYINPTKMPNAPEVVKGVINFRGEVIPVIDLRKKFGLELRDYDNFTVIIVLEIKDKIVGVIVDQVSDIISFSKEDIQDDLDFGSEVDMTFIRGMAKLEDRLVMLLELNKIVSFEEFRKINKLDSKESKETNTDLKGSEEDIEEMVD